MDGSPPPSLTSKPATETLTPMMAQYFSVKEKADDALLFYRMGDFYELFFDDAVIAANILDITLTRRGKKGGDDIPMCGVPFHAAEAYLARLIDAGHAVAICEQTEGPEEAKKKRGSKAVVAREIVRVVTPGTLTEDSLLDARRHNRLAALTRQGKQAAIVTVDLSTGDVDVADVSWASLADALAAARPAEVILPDTDQDLRALVEGAAPVLRQGERQLRIVSAARTTFNARNATARIQSFYGTGTVDGFGAFSPLQLSVLGAALAYLELTQVGATPALKPPMRRVQGGTMIIDGATRASLDLTSGKDGTRRGSLLEAVDMTSAAPGGRLLSDWISHPLTSLVQINNRLDGIEFFHSAPDLRAQIRDSLTQCPDAARALSRLSLGRGGPRDLALIGKAIELTAKLHAAVTAEAALPAPLAAVFAPLTDHAQAHALAALADELRTALEASSLPLLARDGGFVAMGYHPELDELRSLRNDARQVIATLEEKYRELTGVKSLKIKHSKVLGYVVDVTTVHVEKMQSAPLSETFRQRQTLTNAARFSTLELSELDAKILRAAEQVSALEQEIFAKLCEQVLGQRVLISACADALALLDVLSSLAELAESRKFCRPRLSEAPVFEVAAGRHAVVEHALAKRGDSGTFIPNDCSLADDGAPALCLVTGPNMAGKSTFLRQNALIAVLAHAGSFVPAASADIGIIDRLYSRVGAADDIAQGRSTFMVEMVETASILNQATAQSLVILDEVGRGTSTYDGLSIAWAALEHLHDKIMCRGLFATHYHELTDLAGRLTRLRNISMSVREWEGEVIFLHEVKEGPADRSYGLAVAKLAGLPTSVLKRAGRVLSDLESQAERTAPSPLPLFDQITSELTPGFAEEQTHPCLERIASIDPDGLTPREALETLYDICDLVKQAP